MGKDKVLHLPFPASPTGAKFMMVGGQGCVGEVGCVGGWVAEPKAVQAKLSLKKFVLQKCIGCLLLGKLISPVGEK